MPSLSILIPTAGNRNELLPRVMHSIVTQELIDRDEVLIIGDGPQEQTRQMVEAVGWPFRYVEGPKTGDWGHTQLNHGMTIAQGDYIAVQDDDDVYTPRAIEVIRRRMKANPGRPLLFRFYCYHGANRVVWGVKGTLAPGNIGGHSLIVPRDGRLGKFTPRYIGDFDWIKSTLDNYAPEAAVWCEEIIAQQRPNARVAAFPVIEGERMKELCRLRNICRDEMTNNQQFITDEEHAMWWGTYQNMREDGLAWAYLFKDKDDLAGPWIGFTYSRVENGRVYFSYGLDESFRGKGLGNHLIEHLVQAAQTRPLSAEVWLRNAASKALLQVNRFAIISSESRWNAATKSDEVVLRMERDPE